MSRDCKYILSYETQLYQKPTPMDKDIEFLKEEYPGSTIIPIHEYLYYFEPAKYGIYDTSKLLADQVLEASDGDGFYQVIK